MRKSIIILDIFERKKNTNNLKINTNDALLPLANLWY